MSFSFKLSEQFIEKYKNRPVDWGFKDVGGNALGEITFIRTYSRIKKDGNKEKWWEVCQRVIEGMYTLQKDYVKQNRLPWNDRKAQASAQEAYERLFTFKWTPPGRGLWMMGTDFVMKNKTSSALQNCGFISTGDIDKNDPGAVFSWVMDALMLGIGVGWDTKGKEKQIIINIPSSETITYTIQDSREGWCESIRLLLNSFLKQGGKTVIFDYSLIRKYGEPIKGFGGTASGPQPLIDIHNKISEILLADADNYLGSRCIADIMNLIGTCVVAGNVRRCLPYDSLVQTSNGMIPIELISVGDEVVTGSGKHKVSAVMNSGIQDTVIIHHRFGKLECTPNHRVAVFNSFGSYEFKNASDIKIGDRLVWDSAGYEGNLFVGLPEFKTSDHFNSKSATVPKTLNDDFAWLIGYIHGDGHVSKDGKSIEITAHDNYLELLEKASRIFLEQFNIKVEIKKCAGSDTHNRLRIHRVALNAWFQQHVKISNESISIPQFINSASVSQRSAYLAGLMDADGRVRSDGTIEIAATKYKDYCKQIVSMLSGLGIGSSVSVTDNRGEEFYSIKIVGNRSRLIAKAIMQKHGQSGKFERLPEIGNSPIDFSYPYEMISKELGIKGWKANSGVTTSWLDANGFDTGIFLPTPVTNITSGRNVQTYDIEVEDIHQFTTDGIVVHNSAELALGDPDDEDFVNLKNIEYFPERNSYDNKNPGWGWMSNNSLSVKVGQDYSKFNERISSNGEPGFIWLDTTRKYGRLLDQPDFKDHRVMGFNPCAEQALESYECCTLVEVHINRTESKEDFLRTLKFAYLYGKTVTLLSTHWDKTNAVMQRNRRIGTSITGISGFVENNGLPKFRLWADEGYKEISNLDIKYSEWLGVRESIRKTTVKPSGSVSILSGATPGVHWSPGGTYYLRSIRFSQEDPIVLEAIKAGYQVEEDLVSQNTVVIYFPVKADVLRSEKQVSIFEKINLAAEAQKYWSDNAVSVTVSFDKEKEKEHISTVLNMYEGQLKTVSFLPMGNEVYPQQPYIQISKGEYESYVGRISLMNFDKLYLSGIDAEGDRYCTTDVCEIKKPVEINESTDIDTEKII